MATIQVEDIIAGKADSTGAQITSVYSKVSGRYAVYRTSDQVMIQYSDDDLEGVNQRAALAPLAGLRGQVNGLLDALRARPAAQHQTKLNEYERRLAYALAIALQGSPAAALAEITLIKDDLAEDRASEARARHLLYAAIATAAFILISRLLSSSWFASAFGAFEKGVSPQYWNGAAVGALGAFFSIAIQIRSRQVSIDLQSWDNIGDATLRIFVGATSAVILVALLNTKAVDLMVAGRPLISTTHGLIIAAFAAGFTERLVADFLSGFAILGRQTRPAPVVPVVPRTAANERELAEGAAASRAPFDRALPMTGPVVPEDAEQAVEPNEDQIEAGDNLNAAAEDQTARGPVG
jgi:hypothetical protein